MKKVLVILGPTATGKTDLALQLASKFQGELISCDSRQVYKNLDIGTGKEPGRKNLRIKKGKGFWEIEGIKIWMYDVVPPKKQYSVADYAQQATQVMEDIIKRGKLPIIVGGTGLYLKALLLGLPNLAIPVDSNLRRELEQYTLGELQEKLKSLSLKKWKSLNQSDRQNSRRLLRSIELITMYPYIKISQKSKVKKQKFNILKIGLTAPREILNQRINARLISRIDQGMIQEAEKLHKKGLSFKRMKQLGLEYGMLAELLADKINKEEFIKKLKIKIHQYAKRQTTWFKKEKDISWFDVAGKEMSVKVERKVKSWYNTENDTPN